MKAIYRRRFQGQCLVGPQTFESMKFVAEFASGIVLLVGVFLWSVPSSAYVFSYTSAGNAMHWPSPYKPTFYANYLNSDGLSYSNIFSSFTNSLQRWKATGTSAIDFEYYQGPSNPTQWGSDGKNAIFFSSQAPSGQKLGSSTVGVTYVYSVSSTGVITETDIEFNDDNFTFTTTASDSSQFGDGVHIFLENVATHELGHAFGLNHSAALQSSMIFLESRGQSKPSCDDIQGIAAIYSQNSFTSARGSISGTIQNSGATNIFGAHVLAVSLTRGAVVSATISQSDGTFTLSNLEPGRYVLQVEPFSATSPISSLCGGTASGCYYGTVNSSTICASSTPFKRYFVESSAGIPTVYTVTAGNNNSIGTKTVGCTAMSNPWGVNVDAVGTAPTLVSNALGTEGIGAAWGVGGSVGGVQYFKLSNVSGNIAVKAMSYGLYSRADTTVTIMDSSGTSVPAGVTATANVFTNASSFTNYDSSATLSSAAAADYIVRVTYNADLFSSTSAYPAGIIGHSGQNSLIDRVPFFLVVATVNDATSLLPSTSNPLITNNARCESADSFSSYPDNGSGPPASTGSSPAPSSPSGSSDGGGGCGMIYNSDDGDNSRGGGIGSGTRRLAGLNSTLGGSLLVWLLVVAVLWRQMRNAMYHY